MTTSHRGLPTPAVIPVMGIFDKKPSAPAKRSHHAKQPARTATGNSIQSFFRPPTPPPQVGRPTGPIKKRGRPPSSLTGTLICPELPTTPALAAPSANTSASSASPNIPLGSSHTGVLGKRAAAQIAGAKLRRINWGEGDALLRMQTAVNNWDAKSGTILQDAKEMPLKDYAARVGIPYPTLQKYCNRDEGKRTVLGSSVGTASLFSDEQQQFAVDVIVRHDRGNDGLNRRRCIDVLHDLQPGLKRKNVAQSFDRNVRPRHKDELTGIIHANATTSKRTAITVPQQYRWHSAVDQAHAFLREKNTGLTPDGKTFGEVMDHFHTGGDETCFLASAGDVKIIGDKRKRKHDLPTGQDRTSITLYRVGSSASATGPTVFLPPGQRCKAGWTDEFLIKHGAPKGSTIIMTPTGYMNEDAWVEMAPAMADGIRQMPVICDNPDWWVLKIVDGYGPHTSSAKAMQIYASRKILLLKEEGDSSHVNQSYDQKVAIDDKKSMREALAFLRQTNKLVKGTIDGWALIHVGLAAVRELHPDSWSYSFNKVNLKPSTRVSFPEWIKRIAHYIQGAESFTPEIIRDPYAMLSPFWHGMAPEHKKLAMSIFESCAADDKGFSVECVKELAARVHIPLTEMQNVRVGLELAREDRSHLDREKPEAIVLEHAVEVQDVQAQVASVVTGLQSFELHPKGSDGKPLFTGLALFDHLIGMGRRSVPTGVDLVPSASLDAEYSKQQQQLINPRSIDYSMYEIAKHAHGEGAKQAMARRKLDNLGYVRGQCGILNDPERCQRLKNQLHLTMSLAAISKVEAASKAANAALETTKLIEGAPAAVQKLMEKSGDLTKITMAQMSAIAFKHFKGTVLKGNKAAHIKELSTLITDHPGVLQLNTPPAPPTAPMPAAEMPAVRYRLCRHQLY